jgi:hypothetical protein
VRCQIRRPVRHSFSQAEASSDNSNHAQRLAKSEGVRGPSPGACRILESVSLWSNEEARSPVKIIAWAVRPRACEKKASSAEGAAEMITYCREQCRQIDLTPEGLARYLSGLGGSQNPPRPSAGPRVSPLTNHFSRRFAFGAMGVSAFRTLSSRPIMQAH